MIWQDIVISIVVIIFSLALVPQVLHGFKYKSGAIRHSASIPTFTGLFVLTWTYTTLNLTFSAIFAFVTGMLWLLLFVQRIKYGEAKMAKETVHEKNPE